ncbi:hypothetical protein [Chryseobacterium sp. HSC-36S06]|jgi:hypothetical protein|uniref:hypothetical protein n=1 Tax=Chryseobacterium sp. HSC-36S06 TaxID=2910970 RepID=UPI00209CA782|nr:hypothetical protein [Chryseobacterium sp. HSC-36S06]MCP2037455.1 hypothetical protein [Chryseobacterium sp. HSC-36S06]
MDSKFTFFLLIVSSIIFSQKKNEKFFDEDISIKYEKVPASDVGIGVMGSFDKQAYATFVGSNVAEKNQQYFHYIKFKSINFTENSSQIYLCIYKNNRGLPGEILEGAKFLVNIPAHKSFVTADLSKLKIKVPENGYFVGFEWVLSKENEMKGKISAAKLPYNPTISGFTDNKVNLYSRRKEWRRQQDSDLVAGLALEISYFQLTSDKIE